MSVLEAAQQSRLAALIATRDALAVAIDAGGGTVAQNVAQFRAVLSDIAELEKEAGTKKGTALDEVNARRAAKAAKGPTRSAGAGQRR